ncbi:MAG: pectate lyase [Saprospiraceae bacterium]|nr:pectate lyase [Saprospiraceae bacterium]
MVGISAIPLFNFPMTMKVFALTPIVFLLSFCTASYQAIMPAISTSQHLHPAEEPALAFPGAEGFGRYTSGGRGGRVLFVTNLNDDGPGSLREAIKAKGPRYILFRVSGTIRLKSRLPINNGDVTIAGQTAPGDGITIADYPVAISADNVVIRFLRFRMGDAAAQEADALGGRFQKNIMIDHCSVSWSTDEGLSLYNNENTTVQWTFITESLRNSVHDKGAHGYGGIWGGRFASFHHNLLAHHDSRNPRLGEEAGSAFALSDLVDLRNNVIYNWGGNTCYGGEAMNVNIVNCYYKPGPASKNKERIVAIDKNTKEGTAIFGTWGKYFVSGNVVEGSERATADNWTYGVFNQFSSKYGTLSEAEKAAIRQSAPHPVQGNVTTHTAEAAYEKVLALGGASLVRDAIDERIVSEVRNGSFTHPGSNGSGKGIIDSQADVGAWPELESLPAPKDSSGDGIPDDWKRAKQLDPDKFEANGRNLSTVYDNIEVYINFLVSAIVAQQS